MNDSKMLDTIREILASDYGLRNLPPDWLDHVVWKYAKRWPNARIAFLIANDWQRGLTTLPDA
jgi:hypothetical protein